MHHVRARHYWENEAAERVAFCRVTVLALLRHVTNPRIMSHAALTGSQAWELYQRWLALPEIAFVSEPERIEERLHEFALTMELGPASWTDAYLSAFAIAAGCRIIAFDAGFSRYPGLDLLHLVP